MLNWWRKDNSLFQKLLSSGKTKDIEIFYDTCATPIGTNGRDVAKEELAKLTEKNTKPLLDCVPEQHRRIFSNTLIDCIDDQQSNIVSANDQQRFSALKRSINLLGDYLFYQCHDFPEQLAKPFVTEEKDEKKDKATHSVAAEFNAWRNDILSRYASMAFLSRHADRWPAYLQRFPNFSDYITSHALNSILSLQPVKTIGEARYRAQLTALSQHTPITAQHKKQIDLRLSQNTRHLILSGDKTSFQQLIADLKQDKTGLPSGNIVYLFAELISNKQFSRATTLLQAKKIKTAFITRFSREQRSSRHQFITSLINNAQNSNARSLLIAIRKAHPHAFDTITDAKLIKEVLAKLSMLQKPLFKKAFLRAVPSFNEQAFDDIMLPPLPSTPPRTSTPSTTPPSQPALEKKTTAVQTQKEKKKPFRASAAIQHTMPLNLAPKHAPKPQPNNRWLTAPTAYQIPPFNDTPDAKGMTPLMKAALAGDAKKVSQLLRRNASLDIPKGNPDTCSIFYYAIKGQNLAVLKAIAETYTNKHGHTNTQKALQFSASLPPIVLPTWLPNWRPLRWLYKQVMRGIARLKGDPQSWYDVWKSAPNQGTTSWHAMDAQITSSCATRENGTSLAKIPPAALSVRSSNLSDRKSTAVTATTSQSSSIQDRKKPSPPSK